MPRTGLTGNELKERAIEVARDQIRLLGFDRFRLSDVAKTIGVSHAALYAHFANKAALLDAVTEQWTSSVSAAVANVSGSELAPQERITEWFVILYRIKREKAVRDPELHRAFGLAAEHNKAFVMAHLAVLMEQLSKLLLEAKVQNPEKTARLIYKATAAFHHPTMIAQTAHDDLEAELRDVLRVLWLGLHAV